MVANRLQRGLINSSITPWESKLSKYFFFKWDYIFFFSNSDRDFYSKNNNVSQVYTEIPKIYKKNVKNATIVYVPFCAKHWRHISAIPHVIIIRHLFFQLFAK
jgi:hypothetical protein